MPSRESDIQRQCSQLKTMTGDSHMWTHSICFAGIQCRTKTGASFFLFFFLFFLLLFISPSFFFPRPIFSLGRVSLTATEIWVFVDNSHAWYVSTFQPRNFTGWGSEGVKGDSYQPCSWHHRHKTARHKMAKLTVLFSTFRHPVLTNHDEKKTTVSHSCWNSPFHFFPCEMPFTQKSNPHGHVFATFQHPFLTNHDLPVKTAVNVFFFFFFKFHSCSYGLLHFFPCEIPFKILHD